LHVYLYSALVGLLAGLSAAAFNYLLNHAQHFMFTNIFQLPYNAAIGESGFVSDRGSLFFLIVPALGGLLTGLVLYITPEVRGSGIDIIIHSFHHEKGFMRPIVPVFKAIATIFTLASGGSAGKEGPLAQIGAGLGSFLSDFLKTGSRARRSFLLAGMAGGLGAIFHAPFGGAVTAVETVYKEDIESDSLIPALISSVTAYMLYTAIGGESTFFHPGELPNIRLAHLHYYALLGIIASIAGSLFIIIFQKTQNIFASLKLPLFLKPAVGGLLAGILIYFYPNLVGSGFGIIEEIFQGNLKLAIDLHTIGWLLFIAILKLFSTSFTVGSGGSGGLFAPSLFIGGILGAFTGTVISYITPAAQIPIHSFILVGMGAFFAGVARAPVASMIMVCDLAGTYKLLPALMIVSIISIILFRGGKSIYVSQLQNRFKSPAHYFDMSLAVLSRRKIKDEFFDFRTIAIVNKNSSLSDLEERAPEIQASDFVVTDSENKYYGLISLRTIGFLEDRELVRTLISVGDATDTTIPPVKKTGSIADILQVIMDREIDKAAIVDEDNKVLGYVRYIDLLKKIRHFE
jgi:chloride channel protein, CIC family